MNSSGNDTNLTNKSFLPRELFFNSDSAVSIVAYSCLFVIAFVGNLTVFWTLIRKNRRKKSRLNLFILHLCIADLTVTLVMMPLEIGWHATVSWRAGDIACRVFMFFRIFGFYLSSFILVIISLDRYFAIAKPLRIHDGHSRSKILLSFAWGFSILASFPQSIIFHTEEHPDLKGYKQCVTYNFYPTKSHELAYNVFNYILIYLLPLLVIVVSYSLIILHISRRANGATLQSTGQAQIRKAKTKTLKLTVVIGKNKKKVFFFLFFLIIVS